MLAGHATRQLVTPLEVTDLAVALRSESVRTARVSSGPQVYAAASVMASDVPTFQSVQTARGQTGNRVIQRGGVPSASPVRGPRRRILRSPRSSFSGLTAWPSATLARAIARKAGRPGGALGCYRSRAIERSITTAVRCIDRPSRSIGGVPCGASRVFQADGRDKPLCRSRLTIGDHRPVDCTARRHITALGSQARTNAVRTNGTRKDSE